MRFKTYTVEETGIQCKIGFRRYFEFSKVLFIMHYPNVEEAYYYMPSYTFKDTNEVVNHILSNLTTDGLKIEVEPVEIKNKEAY